MTQEQYFDCEISAEVPQRELKSELARYIYHEHRVVYPKEEKGRLFKITAALQFCGNNTGDEIMWQMNFDTLETLDDLLAVLTNMKKDWEKRYQSSL